MVTSVLFGIAIGTLLGLTGAGGGVLALPALMLGLGMTIEEAVPVALISIAAAASLGSAMALKQRQVRYRAAILMAAFGTLCAPAGVWIAHRLPAMVIVLLFCSTMAVVAARMLVPLLVRDVQAVTPQECHCTIDPDTGRFRWNWRCASILAVIGAAAGLCTGLLGIGGGFLIVPAFKHFTDLTMQACAATSLAVIAMVSGLTAAGLLASGAKLLPSGWIFASASLAGMLLGRRCAAHVPAQYVQAMFAASVMIVALLWLGKAVS